jgi:hypothetical protein
MLIRLFLSHASEDKPLIRDLYTRLKAIGLEPWLDEIDLVPGQNWKDTIQRQIQQSDYFLACLTSNSGKAGFLRKEFEYALERYAVRRSNNISLIPVKLSPSDIPDIQISSVTLRDFHWLEYWIEGGVEKIIQIIRKQNQFTVFSDWIRGRGYRLRVLTSPFLNTDKVVLSLEIPAWGFSSSRWTRP